MRRPRIRIRWRKRTSRWAIGAAVLFFISLFALQFVLMNYTKSILQNALNLQLQLATGGKFSSSFDNIGVDYTSRSFIIHDLLLVSGQQDKKEGVDAPNNYTIFIPQVRINGINLRKAYLDNFLDIQSLELLKPVFKLDFDFDAEDDSTPFLRAEFYKILPESIEELRIGQIQLKEASLTLSTTKNGRQSFLDARSMDSDLNNFHLSAQNADKPGKIFFTDTFYIAADSVEGSLSDQLYRLQLGSVKISSADSSAFISNLSLQPQSSPQAIASKTSFNNLYQVNFPQVYLYGLSFNDLYHSRDLLAKEATIISPSLQLYNLKPLKAGQKENFRLENLYPAIDKLLNSIQITDVYLRNGQLRIDELNDTIVNKLMSQIELAHVKNFLLDSAASSKKDKLLYADELMIKLHRYSLRLSDEVHLLQANSLTLSSADNFISAEGFRIQPDSTSKRIEENIPFYNAQAANISVLGVDMLQAYNNNNLLIDSLLVNQPTFLLSTTKQKEEKQAQPIPAERFHEEDLYGLIQDYLYTLQINLVAVKEGRLEISRAKQQESDGFFTRINQARLWNFRLDSASAYQMNKLFYANDFDVEIAGYTHDLPDNIHTVTAGKIGISTLQDRIIVSDVQIKPAQHQFPYPNLRESPVKAMIDLKIPELRLEGVDILKAYLQKQLLVEQVYIPEPTIALGSLIDNKSERVNIIKSSVLYDLMKEYVELIQVQDLHLQEGGLNLAFYDPNGLITISGKRTDIQIDNFRFDSLTSSNPKRLFFADNVRVEVEEYETRLSDNIHIIRAENFVASTSAQEIQATNVAIENTRDGYTNEELLVIFQKKGFVQLRLAEIRLSGINFDEAYYEESLHIDSIQARAPVVSYTYIPQATLQSRNRKVILEQVDIYESMAPYLQKLSVGDLQMQNGSFYSFQQEDNQRMEHITLKGMSLDLHNFQLDSTAIFDNQHFFYTDDIRLQVKSYQQELLDKEHSLTAQNLLLSTGQKRIEATNIRLEPKVNRTLKKQMETAGNNQYLVHLPALEIEGISFDEVFRKNRLYIEDLSLRQPTIEVHQYNSAENEKPQKINGRLTDLKLDQLLQGNLDALTVKEARIEEGKGTYTLYKDNKTLQVRSQQFEAKVENFHLQEDSLADKRPFNAHNIEVKFNAFERKLADSLHMLRIGEISYSTSKKLLEAKAVSLAPRNLPNQQEEMRSAGTNLLFNVSIPLSQIKGLEADKLDQDSLLLQYILIQDPQIGITRFTDLLKNESNGEKKSWEQLLKDEFSLVQTDSILLKNATASLTSVKEADTSNLTVGNIFGTAYNFRIDSLIGVEKDRLFYADNMKASIRNYKTTLDDGLYELNIPLLTLDSEQKSLIADSITITPLTTREEFAIRKGYQTDQFSFRNKQLKIGNIDFLNFLTTGKLEADSLVLDGFYLMVHRDKSQAPRAGRYPKMPQEMLRNLEIPVLLGGVEIKNGYIGYSEKIKGARGTGFIDLTDLHILSDTISNYPELLKNGLSTNLELTTRLMGTGQLKAFFDIPLGDSLNRHYFEGTLDQMYLPDFNPILENTVFIKIKDGHVNQIRFEVEANKYEANGQMEFSYTDLRVALVNKKTGRTGGLVKQIGSLVANVFVVNSSNEETEEQSLRVGKMHYERDKTQTTINYWIKTLVDGFKSSIGI